MSDNPIRWYAVSHGNGNDGVSHMFPDYYVRTDNPWRLAKLAMLAQFKPGEGYAWAKENIEVDGEAEYTIQGVIYNPPEENDGNSDAEESDDYGRSDYCDANGAWMLCDVFPVEDDDVPADDPYKSCFASIDAAFSADFLALVPAEG